MTTKRTLIAAALGAVAAASMATGATAATRWENHHPRQDQVFDRLAHQRQRIRDDYRDGDLSRRQEARLLARDNRIAREDRFFARTNGGYITKGEQRFMNRQENGTSRRIPE